MKVILETELERYAWSIMVSAHYKWEKNNGSLLHDQMERYFNDIYKEETEEAIKKEVERHLRDKYGEEFFVTGEQYVKSGLESYSGDDLSNGEKKKLEQELRQEHREVNEDISWEREDLPDDMRCKLHQIYYTFFNAPEKLTVLYNGEVIQDEKNPP